MKFFKLKLLRQLHWFVHLLAQYNPDEDSLRLFNSLFDSTEVVKDEDLGRNVSAMIGFVEDLP
jgi:hypothetical protein